MEVYDSLAASYDARHENPWTRRMRAAERPFLELAFGKVLDVGCGTGYHLRVFPGAVGVDCSEGMLREARKRGKAVKARAEKLPFAGESFDCALCMFTVFNQCNAGAAVKEMSRVLKPSGLCIVSVASVYDRNWSFARRLAAKELPRNKTLLIRKQKVRLRLFTRDEMVTLFARNGFRMEKFRGIFALAVPRWGDSRPLTLKQRLALLFERAVPGKYGSLYLFAFRKGQ